MEVKNIANQSYIPASTVELKIGTQKTGNTKESTLVNSDVSAEYVPTKEEQKVTYQKPYAKIDTETIQKLKEESQKTYQHLREMVRRLLEKQGFTFKDLGTFDGEIPIDEETRIEAQAAIGEGGPLSPESVSDRIVAFAKAISGGDKSKLDTLRGAIEKGFEEATQFLGGQLPEISKKTYNLIMEKLDGWVNEEE